jgi:release factor glutamine methyltransferase
MKLSTLKKKVTEQLTLLYGRREAVSLFSMLAEHYLKMNNIMLQLDAERELSEEEVDLLLIAHGELIAFRPIQYIIGSTSFGGLTIQVKPGVLIPRPETEEMCFLALRQVESHLADTPVSVLDICTGSGCIALFLKQRILSAAVTATDISETAIGLARQNASDHQLPVCFICADFLDEKQWMQFGMYHLLISNPPYITHSEMNGLPENVAGYEPELALFVPDEDPLLFYRKIMMFSKLHMYPGGFLMLEFNERFADEMLSLAKEFGFRSAEVLNDFRGKPRFLSIFAQI